MGTPNQSMSSTTSHVVAIQALKCVERLSASGLQGLV